MVTRVAASVAATTTRAMGMTMPAMDMPAASGVAGSGAVGAGGEERYASAAAGGNPNLA